MPFKRYLIGVQIVFKNYCVEMIRFKHIKLMFADAGSMNGIA